MEMERTWVVDNITEPLKQHTQETTLSLDFLSCETVNLHVFNPVGLGFSEDCSPKQSNGYSCSLSPIPIPTPPPPLDTDTGLEARGASRCLSRIQGQEPTTHILYKT